MHRTPCRWRRSSGTGYLIPGSRRSFRTRPNQSTSLRASAGIAPLVVAVPNVWETARPFAKLTYFEEGRPWWEWHQMFFEIGCGRRLSIAFAFVATHNHFVLDRGGKVFKRHRASDQAAGGSVGGRSPWPAGAAQLVGGLLLDAAGLSLQGQRRHQAAESATTCGTASTSSTAPSCSSFRCPAGCPSGRSRPSTGRAGPVARRAHQPSAVAASADPTRGAARCRPAESGALLAEMISAQEELDWHCLHLYGLTDEAADGA